MKSTLRRIFNTLGELTKSRIFVIGALFTFLFALLVQRVFVLQVIEGQTYFDSFTYRIQKDTELPSSRGTIYDRNGKVLAYNRLANSITIEDNSLLKTNAQKNDMIAHLIRLIEDSGYEAIYNIPIRCYEDGTLEFTSTGNSRLRFIRNVYGKDSIDQLSEKQNTLQLCHCFVVIKAVARRCNLAWRKQPDFIIVMQRAHAYSRNFAYFIDRFHKPRPPFFAITAYTIT